MAGQDSSWGGRLAVEEISRNGQMVQRPVWHLTGLSDDEPGVGEYSIFHFAQPATFTEITSGDGKFTLVIDANAPCFEAGTWVLIVRGYKAPNDPAGHRTLGASYFVAAARLNQDSVAYQLQGTFETEFNIMGLQIATNVTPAICVAARSDGFAWQAASSTEQPRRLTSRQAVEVSGVAKLGFFAMMDTVAPSP